MGTAGHLGHDPTEPGVLLDAAGHRVGEQALTAHQTHAGLVAAGLQSQDQRLLRHGSAPRA